MKAPVQSHRWLHDRRGEAVNSFAKELALPLVSRWWIEHRRDGAQPACIRRAVSDETARAWKAL